MNEHQLRCFVAAARYLNFTKAAQDLFMTQAAITYQVNELEKSLGVRLFDRAKGGLALTRAGMSLQASAEQLLEEMAQAKDRARRAERGEGAVLRLGCFGDVLHPLLPAILAAFRESHPEVQVVLKQALARELVEDLNNGEVDVAFLTGYGDYIESIEWLDRTWLFQDSHVAVVPKDHPLAQASSTTFEELDGERKILLSEEDLLAREESMDESVGPATLLKDPQSVRILVDAGYGVCVCVKHVAQFYDPHSVCVPIEDSTMDIFACRRKDNARAAVLDFVALAERMAPQLIDE